MHRKHYQALAAVFKRHREEQARLINTTVSPMELIDDLEDEICNVLMTDNPAFSYEKFTNASGREG